MLILDSVTWSEAEIYTRHSQKSSGSHVIAFFKRQWHIPIFQLPLQHHTDRGTQSPILKCTLLNKFYVIKQNNMSTIMQSAILYCEICLLKEKLYSNQSRDMVRSLFFFQENNTIFHLWRRQYKNATKISVWLFSHLQMHSVSHLLE